jgi:hypothetical protein
VRATRPRSPTTTFSRASRCSGSPEAVSHRSSDAALSRDSISQPHGTPASASRCAGADADVAVARTESREEEGEGRSRRGARGCDGGRNCGRRVVAVVVEAIAMPRRGVGCVRVRGGLSARSWHVLGFYRLFLEQFPKTSQIVK